MLPGKTVKVVLLATSIVVLSACQPTLTLTTAEIPQEPAVQIEAAPGDRGVDPGTPVVVQAQNGLLMDVQVTGPEGLVPGSLDESGTMWTSEVDSLDYGASYTIAAQAFDARGNTTSDVTQFSTLEPEKFFKAYAEPADGEVVGVGVPITVNFNKTVKNKSAVEEAMVVRTPEPLVGAWAWKDNKTAEFRPKELWPGDMDVTVELNFEGVQAKDGVFGKENSSANIPVPSVHGQHCRCRHLHDGCVQSRRTHQHDSGHHRQRRLGDPQRHQGAAH